MRVIKKYSNRRLYDTSTSAYVNLDDLAGIVRAGDEVSVVDASSGEDLTRPVLLQVILEARGGAHMFPVGLLHRVIRYSADDPLQRVALQQLSAGLEMLDVQVTRMERQFGWWRPDVPPPAGKAPEPEPAPTAEAPATDEEVDALRQRLADLEARLSRR